VRAGSTTYDLVFRRRPNLTATMGLQVPALAWQPTPSGFTRVFYPQGCPVRVVVRTAGQALRFLIGPTAHTDQVQAALAGMFRRQVADLDVGRHPALQALRERYGGVVLLQAEPFETLVLTVLVHHRPSRTARSVYPGLVAAAGGPDAARLAAMDRSALREVVEPAGPYKAAQLAAMAGLVCRDPERFDRAVRRAPVSEALAVLTALPGVGPKTAACVLVCAGRLDTLPVDRDLVRVAARLGLTRHPGGLTPPAREKTITALLAHGPDVAAAHILLLAVGRRPCTANRPRCGRCFLHPNCPSALPRQP
jgi:endonuclease III